MKLCAIIPAYRHYRELPRLIGALKPHCDSVFIVDDGNDSPAREAIAALHAPDRQVIVLRQQPNAGKGAAMVTGFRAALAAGHTHALQIDADGQHDTADVPRFIAAMRAAPEAMICGQAMYDESVPRARKVGRNITHFWVWVETCSLDIADSMCGYRLYPLRDVAAELRGAPIGARMDFDTEIAVRLHWRGVRVINLPTRVIYPEGNVSNFAMLADNVRISLMHTRLVIQAPFRLLWKALAHSRCKLPNGGGAVPDQR
jgi:glycosyltransferase involved in cell wall biosynthesis